MPLAIAREIAIKAVKLASAPAAAALYPIWAERPAQ